MKSITIIGTDNKDIIDLGEVLDHRGASWAFRNLDVTVKIDGRCQDDRLVGSGSFNTVCGGGRDTFTDGVGTNDTILDWQLGVDIGFHCINVVNGRRIVWVG